MLSLHTRPQHQLTQNLPRACSLVSYIPLARSTPSIRAARRAPRHPHAPGSAQRAAPPPLPPERELPAPKTPPDSLRTTFTLTRPSAWPPRARRRRALPVRLTQAFRDCPGQVLSRRMPGVVGPSPLTPHGPPFGPVQDVPVEGTTAGGPSVTDGRIVSAGRSAVRPSRESKIRSPLSLWPPVSRDHGLRLRLMSAASSRLPLESLLTGKP